MTDEDRSAAPGDGRPAPDDTGSHSAVLLNEQQTNKLDACDVLRLFQQRRRNRFEIVASGWSARHGRLQLRLGRALRSTGGPQGEEGR